MSGKIYAVGKMVIIVVLMAILAFTGCKGSDTREEVDDTVEEFAGKKKVDQMKAMKKSIGEIDNQQSERFNQLDELKE